MLKKDDCFEDVLELSSELRDIENGLWKNLRHLIESKNLRVAEVLFVAFAENEAGFEIGLLVSKESCFEFEVESFNYSNVIKWLSGRENLDLYDDLIQYVDWAQDSFDYLQRKLELND